MDKYIFFWKTMELCDWNHEGDDELVLMPVIKYLSSKDDDVIFKFDDLMSELLYTLDTQELADQAMEMWNYFSDDDFLYSRCVALINGADFYKETIKGKHKEIWTMEFEALLYLPQMAWALKHQKEEDDYPHITHVNYDM